MDEDAFGYNLAITLARVGDPQDMADLHQLIRSDIARVRKGREARLRGERGPLADGAVMACSNWHVRAVAWLDSEKADEVLLDVFNEPEYEIEAGWALVRLARKQNDAEQPRHWVPDYRVVWEAREGRRENVFDEERRTRYADMIKKRVHTLLVECSSAKEPESFNSRLEALAEILASVDGRDSAALVMDVMQRSGQWDGWTRVSALEALLRSGAELPADATVEILNPTIEQTLSEGIDNNQNRYLVERCLCLLAFVDDPSKSTDRIRAILSRTHFQFDELRNVVTALGQSQSKEALTLLLELAGSMFSGPLPSAREWMKAVADLGFPEAKELC